MITEQTTRGKNKFVVSYSSVMRVGVTTTTPDGVIRLRRPVVVVVVVV